MIRPVPLPSGAVSPVHVTPPMRLLAEVLDERLRQIHTLMYSPEHDDFERRNGDLGLMAAARILIATHHTLGRGPDQDLAATVLSTATVLEPTGTIPHLRRQCARRLLVEAATLCMAEAERLERVDG